MAKLIYTALMSLDGYIEDATGGFDWAAPDEEVHRFINDREREVGTYLVGRRMYETMAVWETDPALAAKSEILRDYAEIWQAAEKIVFSKTLDAPSTSKTRIEREFDPAVVRQIKESAGSDLSVGGAELGSRAFEAGLVDECRLFIAPVIVGGGKRALPDGVRLGLDLVDERCFDGGMVYVHYEGAG